MNVGRCAAGLALFCALAMAEASAQSTASGTWSIVPSRTAGQVRFDIRQDDANSGSHDENSEDVDVSALGLSRAQLESSGNRVTFTVAREAGSFTCEGWLSGGKGGGTFDFTPSATYLVKMRALGYGDISPHQEITAAMIDLTTAYVGSIERAGYAHLPFEKLIGFRALGVDEAFVQSMRAEFANADIDAENMIALRALQVNADYINQMRAAGNAVATPGNAISLRALHVDSAYVKELAAAGYSHVTSEQLIQLRALHIDAAYIKRVEAHGIPHPTLEDLVRLKAMNII